MKKFFLLIVIVILSVSLVSATTTSQKESCNFIIHGATTALGGMTIALANVFDLSFAETTGESISVSILGFFSTAIAVRVASQWAFGWIPFLGNTINAATMFGMIEWIGWTVADAFDEISSASVQVATKVGGVVVTVAELLSKLAGSQ